MRPQCMVRYVGGIQLLFMNRTPIFDWSVIRED